MENYQAVANGPVMWLACAPAVLIVLFQAFLFYKKSRQQAIELKMDPNQIRITMRSAAISSIGPCMVIMATLLALIQYVGTPLAWMRCDIIGAAQELSLRHIFFIEDVVAPEQVGWLREIHNYCATPLALGELYVNDNEWRTSVVEHSVDFVRAHISDIGGITPARRMACLLYTSRCV